MDLQDPRSRAFAAAGAAFVALGIAGLWSLDGPAERRLDAPSFTPAPAPRVDPPAVIPEAPSAVVRADPTKAVEATGWSSRDAAPVVARRYREARDKRRFFAQAMATGGGAYVYFARVAAVDCLLVSHRGMVGAEQQFLTHVPSADPAYTERLAEFRATIEACAGFEADPVKATDFAELNQQLKGNDDAMGRAATLSERSTSAAEREATVALARRVVEEGDPYALRYASPAIVSLQMGGYTYKDNAESRRQAEAVDREFAAWFLATCAIGLDCGRDSAWMHQSCAWGGQCGFASLEEIVLHQAGREKTPAILRRRDEILRAMLERDWAALGL